jgi:undecaprenyl-diphosphatase
VTFARDMNEQGWDTALLLWINGHHNALLDGVLVTVAAAGEFCMVWWFLCAGLALRAGAAGRRTALLCVLGIVLTHAILYTPLHAAWHRPRPYLDPSLAGIRQLGFAWHSSSFPSGHADTSVAGAAILGGRLRWWRLPLAAFAVLTLYSRPYCGMHYPSDVLIGSLVGLLGGCATLTADWLVARRSRGRDEPPATGPAPSCTRQPR